MSGDLISREALIKKIFPYGMPDDGNYPINAKAVRRAIEEAPESNLRHWLESEIRITTERLQDKSNPMYDGVCVGNDEAKELQKRHIKFCERLLKMI